MSDRVITGVAVVLFLAALSWWFLDTSAKRITSTTLSPLATPNASIVEGVVGAPRFINPILATRPADKDLSALVFRGLLKLGADGQLVPDLADAISVSDDGRVYTITLRADATFHDLQPVTAADVAYTIEQTKDPQIASPWRANFFNTTVVVVDERTVEITLAERFTPFIENLTIGILPKHAWENVRAEDFAFHYLNEEPVGAGPYQIATINRDQNDRVDSILLKTTDEKMKPVTFEVQFFDDENELLKAFESDQITNAVFSDTTTTRDLEGAGSIVMETSLPQTYGVFFNQSKSSLLRDETVREALSLAIDRRDLIDTVLDGYGSVLTGPIPAGFGVTTTDTAANPIVPESDQIQTAATLLEQAGWELNENNVRIKEIDDVPVPLTLTIATADSPTLNKTADYLATAWSDIGVTVTVDSYSENDLTQSIIRPRNYEALLFGIDLTRALDLYAFWHSSERDDPGSNIARYTNITVDAALEDARDATSPSVRDTALEAASTEIQTEFPAVFLFTPHFTYVSDSQITIPPPVGLSQPAERFTNLPLWHIKDE